MRFPKIHNTVSYYRVTSLWKGTIKREEKRRSHRGERNCLCVVGGGALQTEIRRSEQLQPGDVAFFFSLV